MGLLAVTAMIVTTLAIGVIMYLSEFRKPYLNPRVRWWETSPRYKADLPVEIEHQHQAVLVDISRTGLLLEWNASAPNLEEGSFCRLKLPTDLALDARVVRKTPRGFGLEFYDLSSDQKRKLRRFLLTLAQDPTRISR
jgi:c-di-GMP-binding flagellar brake protein YcgR